MNEVTTQASSRDYVRPLLVLAVLLLAGVLATNIYSIYSENQQRSAQQERADTARALLDTQSDLIFELVSNYEQDAYGPSVDRIAEQQLIATEYQLTVLQMIASQNLQIIGLLADSP